MPRRAPAAADTYPEKQAEIAAEQPTIPPPRRDDPAIQDEIKQPTQTWPLEQVADPRRVPAPAAPSLPIVADGAVRDQAKTWTAAEKLEYLRRKNLGNCTRCKLAPSRKHIVFGVGDPEADLMFIGEAPGFDEDRLGEPFVGMAGKRLTEWLGRLGLTREQVYIANVLKCRPPNNRDPEPDEVEKCSPFLKAQIRAIQPKVIVALGRYAGMLMTGGKPDTTLRSMRGRMWPYRDAAGGLEAALFVTYHPSYVIRQARELAPGQRNPADDTVMADLQQAMSKLRVGS
ncbi:MAG: uracil-DNA glycosylase [Myxococcales bacterium]|nr:uracil-DNA glycosylase [Myxococcales bacterium]